MNDKNDRNLRENRKKNILLKKLVNTEKKSKICFFSITLSAHEVASFQ